SKNYIWKDKETFFRSWRRLSYSLADDLRIVNSDSPDMILITFTFDFTMETPTKTIRATAKNTWGIADYDGSPRIISEKQTRINRNSF
ncbi:MAG TPA: hypothetical protein VEF34_00340, partial [Syntrophobacteraceae bacterium]|nr:hypothetical protein [Syntrophobacteraceae bacterium]